MRRLLLSLILAAAALAAAPAASLAVEPGIVIGPRFGVPSNVDEFGKTDESGARWVRIFVDWNVLEKPADDSYDWGAINTFKARVAQHAADGTKVLVVVSMAPKWANGSDAPNVPPRDPAEYGEFVAFLAGQVKGHVHAWELWNEPDDDEGAGGFWAGPPDPAAYAALLKATYPRIKAVDPALTVVTGGLVANDYEFVQGLLANGARDSFDAVGVHTDTACLTSPPDEFYREPDGRIGRYSFTGYREIHALTGKPIWMTELGWSTTPAECARGGRAGTKPGGVSEAEQAAAVAAAYACMQTDPFVAVALWFSLQDVSTSTIDDHNLGLLRNDGSAKPAWTAFQQWSAARPARRCGAEVDRVAPQVSISAPRQNQQYLERLLIKATATDATTGVRRMEILADGVKVPGSQPGGTFELNWLGARELSIGRHTITVRALDGAANWGEASVVVVKDRAGNIKVGKAALAFKVKKRASGEVQLTGRVSAAAGELVQPKGRVRVFVAYKKGRKWVVASRYTKGIAKPFSITATLKKRGQWRIHAQFVAEKPYATVRTKYHLVRG